MLDRLISVNNYSVTYFLMTYKCGYSPKSLFLTVNFGIDLYVNIRSNRNEQPRRKRRGIKTEDHSKSVRPKGRGIDPKRLKIRHGSFYELSSSIGVAHRRVVASQEVYDLLHGQWVDQDWEDRRFGLRADIDAFLQGKVINVAIPKAGESRYSVKSEAFLRLLVPHKDEVWEIRCRHPDPNLSIRIFGRFAGRDCYVAIAWSKRPTLGPPKSRAWRDAIVRCKSEWNKSFSPYQPITGAAIHDYITGKFIAI